MCFINRRTFCQDINLGRKICGNFSAIFISCTDLNFIQVIQNIKFGDGKSGQAVQADGIFQNHHVQPSAASFASGGGAELGPGFLDFLTGFIK